MADRAQKVAVGRAGEEVEIIPATLKRPGQHQELAGTRIWSPIPYAKRETPTKALGREVGHMRASSGGVDQHSL